ncbi:hypothetical protein [Aliiglaciecola sp. NS0011-25]
MTIGRKSNDIAFAEISAFCRTFKRYTNESPQDYRANTNQKSLG